jgi:hypothetical protein
MRRNLPALRLGRWRTAAIAASGVIAVAGLAVVAPGPAAAAAPGLNTVIAATSSKVTCTKRPSIQPPPLGVVRSVPARDYASQSTSATGRIQPVCPLGEVPVVKGLSRRLPHGNPDQARRRVRPGSLVAVPAPGPQIRRGPICDGTSEDGSCFYWASASDIRADQGGGLTMTIERPSVVGADPIGTGHSLEEMSVQAGPSYDNIVEVGSIVLSGETDPQLFVYHWVDGVQTCYDGCGYQQYSNTYYPGMDLSAMVGQSVYNGYVYYKGNWWAWFNDQWLGYFPGSLWDGQFQASQQVQWFGEVAATQFPPLTQMGDGLLASDPAAAPMSTLCDVNAAAWRCFYYNQQSLYESDAALYTIEDAGFGAIRLGGSNP